MIAKSDWEVLATLRYERLRLQGIASRELIAMAKTAAGKAPGSPVDAKTPPNQGQTTLDAP